MYVPEYLNVNDIIRRDTHIKLFTKKRAPYSCLPLNSSTGVSCYKNSYHNILSVDTFLFDVIVGTLQETLYSNNLTYMRPSIRYFAKLVLYLFLSNHIDIVGLT